MHAKDRKRYKIQFLCDRFGVSKQAYYKRDTSTLHADKAREEMAVTYALEAREKAPGMGGKKLWHMYKKEFAEGTPLGRDRFLDALDKYGLKLRQRKRKPRTTNSNHGFPLYVNLVKDIIPERPNQIWVSDITYIPIHYDGVHYKFSYLSVILDSYSKEIVGWSLGDSLDTRYPIEALNQALKRLESSDEVDKKLIHHSDRGCQYASHQYVSILKRNDIDISMTETPDPKDNAQAERINNTIKNELLKGKRFKTIDEAKTELASVIEFYNTKRPHMSLNFMTPLEASKCEGKIPKRWKSYREEYLENEKAV